MIVKTSELTGAALDWAVALAEGRDPRTHFMWAVGCFVGSPPIPFRPSTDWTQGGPIKERERIISGPHGVSQFVAQIAWDAPLQWFGPTELVAVMRCLVASKLGEEVEIPEELTK